MICNSELCEYNGVCVNGDNVNCLREQNKPLLVESIETFPSEPFNEFGWCFKYYKDAFYNTGTGEKYSLRKKGKSYQITPEFLKHVYEGYHRTSINENVISSKIKNVLEEYIVELIKEKII